MSTDPLEELTARVQNLRLRCERAERLLLLIVISVPVGLILMGQGPSPTNPESIWVRNLYVQDSQGRNRIALFVTEKTDQATFAILDEQQRPKIMAKVTQLGASVALLDDASSASVYLLKATNDTGCIGLSSNGMERVSLNMLPDMSNLKIKDGNKTARVLIGSSDQLGSGIIVNKSDGETGWGVGAFR